MSSWKSARKRTLLIASDVSWDLPYLRPRVVEIAVVAVPGARRRDFANASLDNSSIAFVVDCHVLSTDKVRVTVGNVSLSTADLQAVRLSLLVVERRVG